MIRKLYHSTLDQILVSFSNFLFVIIGARILQIHEQVTLLSIFFLYVLIVVLGYGLNFANAYHHKKSQIKKYLITIFSNYLYVLVFLSFILPAIALKFTLFFSPLFFSMFFYIFCMAVSDFVRRSLYLNDEIKNVFFMNLYISLIRAVFLIFYIAFFSPNLASYLFLWAMPSSLALIYSTKFFTKFDFDLVSINFKDYLHHLNFNKFGLASQSLGWANAFLPFYFLSYFSGLTDAAIFGTVRGLLGFMNLITEQFDTVYPKLFRGIYANKFLHSIHFSLAIFWTIFLILLVMFNRSILRFTLGQNYEPYGYILIFGWIGSGLYLVSRSLIVKKRLEKNFSFEFKASLFTLVITLLGSYLINIYGLFGAVVTGIISSLFFLIFLLVIPKKPTLQKVRYD